MKTYRTRNPRKSPLWQCVQRHHATLVDVYPGTYEPRHGPWRPVISDVFEKFLHCGTMERGFARVRCDHCAHEYLLAFSCKGRWFCPSCHQRKVESTAAHLVDHILLPVPHRHVVLALPRLLRPLFQRHRGLLRRLFTLGQQSITQLLRSALDLPKGTPAFLVTLHTFGEYLDFHPHLHALVADGLLDDQGRFHPAPEIPVRALEETFRTRVLAELLKHRLISPELVERMKSWKHTGFNAHLGPRVAPENRAEREQLCQYVLRNPFSVAKMTLESPGDTVIYRSRLNPKIHRNFEVFTPVDFLATIAQHIPDKGAQMVRYYGLYSNKMRGCARKRGPGAPGVAWPKSTPPPPARLPARKWRDLIRQAWHSDPLLCPKCQKPMRLIAVIDQPEVVEKILRHLDLWCG
ncbi:MAG: transposase, partial [Verrucomicrobiota bacterium]